MTFRGMHFDSVAEALQHQDASGYGDTIVSVRDLPGYYLVTGRVYLSLAMADCITARWFEHEPTGRIMSVPED